jgi:creatinine amidohydrolase
MTNLASPVRWAELKPDEFRARRDACPIVFLPIGLCEPHGHPSVLGLDLLKADYYCDEAARRFGGVVAPSQGYTIHECGFHAPWLAEAVGEENPLMAAIPPSVMLHLFLYQLRAFAHAGFRGVVAVSGHSGGSQGDLRDAAAVYSRATGLPVVVRSDPELVAGLYDGDHAGKYEFSQLMAIRPEWVDLSLLQRQHAPNSGGRLALGLDAAEATAELGRSINESIVAAIGREVAGLREQISASALPTRPDYPATESIWREVLATADQWRSHGPYPGQPPVPTESRWHRYVDLRSPRAKA